MWPSLIAAVAVIVGAPERVVVVPMGGEASASVHSQLADAVDAGLERGGFEPVRPTTAPSVCEAPDCETTLMRDEGAAFSIRVDVQQTDNVYRLQDEARNASGKLLGTVEDLCEICGVQEVSEMLTDRVAVLSDRLLVVAPAMLEVSVTPAGSSVWVDGTLAGGAPLEVELSTGSHQIRAEREGYVAQRRTVQAVDGVRESIRIDLPAMPRTPQPHRPFTIGGAVLVGAGVGALTAGVSLLAIHDRPFRRDCRADREGNCSHLYDTVGAGAGLTVLGVSAVVAGAVLLVVGRNRKNEASAVSIHPSGMEFRF